MNIEHIETLEAVELAPYARLTESQLRNRLHPEEGLFVCESMKVIRVALQRGVEPVSFLCEEKFLGQVEEMNVKCPVYTGPRELLAQLTGYELSRGVLCCMRRPKEWSVGSGKLKDMRRIGVLDSVVNSENTGAIFRAAAALGIDAPLLTRTCCDPLNRRACRVSMGTVFQVPWTWIDGTKRDELSAKSYPEMLRDLGFKTVALALTDRSVSIDDPCLKEPNRLAIIMGTEGDGLNDSVLKECDCVAKIPMQRGVNSLNVAAAASVAFWELLKV